MPDNLLNDWQSTTDILFADVLHAAVDTQRVGDAYSRRSYVRAVFAAVEGITHGMKRVVLHVCKHWPCRLDANEVERLMDTEIDQRGKSRKRFLSFRDNITFVFRMFAKVHGFDCEADFRCKGWSALLEAAEIRNRVTHPKCSRDLDLSDDDLAKIREAAEWYFPTRDRLVAQATAELKKGI
jgi:hypothetical protein